MAPAAVAGFLWGSRVDRPGPASSPAPSKPAAKAKPRKRRPRPKPAPGFSAPEYIRVNFLRHDVDVYVWSDADWEREPHKPAESWPMHGGGRLWAAVAPRPDGSTPMRVRPRKGAPDRCSLPRWLDIVLDADKPTASDEPAGICTFYRVSVWPRGRSDGQAVVPPGAFLMRKGDGAGPDGSCFIDIDCTPFLEAFRAYRTRKRSMAE